jgi:hypothetical protein
MRGPYKLATLGMSLREREYWFKTNGIKRDDPTVPWNFMCAVAPNPHKQRPKIFCDMNWEDRPQEFYHQASCGHKLPS